MKNITSVFDIHSKMSEIIDADYRLLLLINRMNIPMGFGGRSIKDVCEQHGVDPDCFVFIANLQTNKPSFSYVDAFEQVAFDSILGYLQKSHSYFLDRRLPHIRQSVLSAISGVEQSVKSIILKFFDVYSNEVKEHMAYEDEVIFPYIRSLLGLSVDKCFSIQDFESSHSDIEGKMSDLSKILERHIQSDVASMELTRVLIDLHMVQEELDVHTFIEDMLLIPRVKRLEQRIMG